jgi:hypothetical protein
MEVRRYDWNTGEEKPTGEHVMFSDYDALYTLATELRDALVWTRTHLMLIEGRDYPDSDESQRRFNSRVNADSVLKKAEALL